MGLVKKTIINLLNLMTKRTRRTFSADFKAKVALEAIKNQKTMAQLSQQYQVNAVTIAKWKSEALENLSTVFKGKQDPDQTESSVEIEKLYAQIGHLKVENDFLKKSARKLGIPDSELKW
jgi:transposase-like protein